mmetsp:Transcript_81983/g.171596  ORF Transcript_81983/g.171596 Transcript_81983/m.171596 type:complete len:499 (+) Transcript_81983:91-1587(+)
MSAEDALQNGEEEAEDPQELAERLNPEFLTACQRNDTEAALRLIEEHADPCCEDSRQWSALIWAANHGNDELTRLLIQRGAAEVYKYEDNLAKGMKKKKHSPLHWASFKGHLKVMWLLLRQNLSHHEKDQIGNTPLHLAAAGGSAECCKCLMAQGVDVFAKNDRGHTPFALCTVPEVQELLKSAMSTKACKASGKQFSATVMRYLCSWSLDAFCKSEVTHQLVYESADSTEKEKPVTWCTEVKNMVQDAEHQLVHAMNLNQLDTVTEALAKAEDKPVDCKLVHQCHMVKAKLESEIQLGSAMEVQVVTDLESFEGVQLKLSQAIRDAEIKNADPARLDAARGLRKRLLAEASLLRALEGRQKTTPAHILMLEELHLAATQEGTNPEVLERAAKLIAKLTSERKVQQRIAESAPLCEYASFKEVVGKENLPPWCMVTEQFEDFHEDYKKVVEVADRDQISSDLMNTALAQLSSIETLLVEKKQMEQEEALKVNKKGKKK